ncbi:efflux RND transporter permease subunit [Nocardioides iriomotensis]|uniref:Efflux RND transporter permease subunit n=1 Tax=Nocardioides iriomotensis TaxID=715784 RepID=A0A4Q5J3A4_9ACTN|nr:efflux RND transporter permease subunit [Nocardioides iriomotensis]RYU12039.1 efflux RND transporter permease subunit [Nocardioides iriomotensis]
MVRKLVGSSLKFPALVAALVVGLFAAGFTQIREMPVDALPDFAPVYVEVQTESLGLSAVEVEQLITAPMEQMLLNGVPWLDEISSESIPGLSSIVLLFEPGTDPLEARQVVQERLGQARDLPRVSTAPVMLQPLSSTSRVMMVRVDSTTLTPIEQSVLARWTLKPALQGVPGVANVAIWGQREQQMQVQVDPDRLADEGVTVREVLTTSANSLWVSPLSFVRASTPGTGGFIDTPNQRLGVQHVLPIDDPEDLASVALEGPDGETVLGDDGEPVRLGDVVDVVEDHQPLIGDAVAGNSQGLMLVVQKFPEANVVEVTESVERTLDRLAPGLTDVELDTTVFRPASYVQEGLRTALMLGIIGLVLVLLVVALLYDWRVGVVIAVALPLSLVTAALVLHLRDASMNVMLLAGLAIATAAVVDDAVVDFHNVRVRLAATGADERARTLAVAIEEMRRPMVFATLIVLAAAVPLFWVGLRDGLDGAFFGPVLLSYSLALVVSLIVALTVTPALSALLLRRRPPGSAASPLAGRLASSYGKVLVRGIARPAAALAAFAVLAVAGIAVAPALDADMGPGLQERTLVVHWQAAAGTSHGEMSRITSRVADELRTVPGIKTVGAHVGRAITSDVVSSVSSGELWLTLSSDADRDATVAEVRDVVAGYPGIAHDVQTYTDERAAAYGVGATETEQVVVRVFGQDFDLLRDQAEAVRAALDGVDGAGMVTVSQQPREPQIDIEVDLAAAQEAGLTPGEIRREAATVISGIEVGSLFEEQKIFQVVVIGTQDTRHDLAAVEDLLIDTTPGGRAVRLGDVADVSVTSSPTTIRHHAVSRYVDVVVGVSGRGVPDVATDVEAVLAGLDFQQEYHAEILGDYAAERRVLLEVLGVAGAALVFMFLLFQACLRSWKLAALAFIGLPLALSGGMLAAAATGMELRLGTLLGLLVLVGVYTRNLLALFGHYRALARPDGHRPGVGVVVAGARDRFLPTFVSATALAVLVLPVVVLGRTAGTELLYPAAVVILGGLVTTLAMGLFFLPLMYMGVAPHEDSSDLGAGFDRQPVDPGLSVG